MKIIVFIFTGVLLSTFPPVYAGQIQVVAEIGQPAVDFPDNFIYWNVENPVIGRNGHIAFRGAADTSIYSTNQNTEAVWAGLPGQLHVVIKEGESAIGLPTNVLFSSPDVSVTNTIVVTPAGSVAFPARLAGASTGVAIIVEIGGVVRSVIRTGDHAPGFGPGVTITQLGKFAFTDAGMVINGSTNTSQVALWFWDGQNVSAIATTQDPAGSLYPDCNFFIAYGQYVALNQSGEVAFTAGLIPAVDEAICPSVAILKWKDGQFSEVVAIGDHVPGMSEDTKFNNLWITDQLHINDLGDIGFASTISEQDTSATSIWVARSNGDLEFVAVQGESLPGEPNTLLSPTLNSSVALNGSGKAAFWGAYTLGSGIFIGEPIPNPYAELSTIGTSHLTLLAALSDSPPGFASTWFFSFMSPPLINNQGDVMFYGLVKDALDPYYTYANALWGGNEVGGLHLIAADGMKIEHNGVIRTLSAIRNICSNANYGGLTTNTGYPIQLSDNGEVIFVADLVWDSYGSPSAQSILLAETSAQEASVRNALIVLQVLAGLEPSGVSIMDNDKNGNGKIDMGDAIHLLKMGACLAD